LEKPDKLVCPLGRLEERKGIVLPTVKSPPFLLSFRGRKGEEGEEGPFFFPSVSVEWGKG